MLGGRQEGRRWRSWRGAHSSRKLTTQQTGSRIRGTKRIAGARDATANVPSLVLEKCLARRPKDRPLSSSRLLRRPSCRLWTDSRPPCLIGLVTRRLAQSRGTVMVTPVTAPQIRDIATSTNVTVAKSANETRRDGRVTMVVIRDRVHGRERLGITSFVHF
jgi:hypothetical protein